MATILHRRGGKLHSGAVPPSGLSLSRRQQDVRQAGTSLEGACQATGLFRDSCPEGDGVENRVLVAVRKVSDGWASPGLEGALQREERELSGVHSADNAIHLASPGETRPPSASRGLRTQCPLSAPGLVLKHAPFRKSREPGFPATSEDSSELLRTLKQL